MNAAVPSFIIPNRNGNIPTKWTAVEVVASGFVADIGFDGTTWTAVGSASSLPALWTATSLGGTWTANAGLPSIGSTPLVSVVYAGGVWTAASNYILTSTDPDGTWTNRGAMSPSGSSGLEYGNGEWCYKYQRRLYYTSNPTSWGGSYTDLGDTIRGVKYVDGKWLVGVDHDGIYWSTSLSGASWTLNTDIALASKEHPRGFTYSSVDDLCVTVTSIGALWTASDPTSTWTLVRSEPYPYPSNDGAEIATDDGTSPVYLAYTGGSNGFLCTGTQQATLWVNRTRPTTSTATKLYFFDPYYVMTAGNNYIYYCQV